MGDLCWSARREAANSPVRFPSLELYFHFSPPPFWGLWSEVDYPEDSAKDGWKVRGRIFPGASASVEVEEAENSQIEENKEDELRLSITESE